MRTRSILVTTAAVAFTATLASAELVGSLHVHPNDDVTNAERAGGLRSRTSAGTSDANTQGTVEGEVSFVAGRELASPITDVGAFADATKFRDVNRYGGKNGGIVVWDYDLTGLTTNAWELNVDYDSRQNTTGDPLTWYVSFNGFGRTLDTTVVTNLPTNTAGGTDLLGDHLRDVTKYIKIGQIANAPAATNVTWDLTDIVNEAIANGGSIRLAYWDNTYQNEGPRFINDSGLIATDSTTATPVTYPRFVVADTFESGSGSATNGPITNGWSALLSGDSPAVELKEYNVASSGILNIRDALKSPFDGTNEVHKGFFDSVQRDFDAIPLANVGDYLELTLDVGAYQDTSGAAITNCNGPMYNIALVDSSRTNNAGWGFRAKPAHAGSTPGYYSSLRTYNSAQGFPQDAGLTTVREATHNDGTMDVWKLRITRIPGDTYELIPSLNGVLFGSSKDAVFTNATCVGAIYDTLVITPRGNDIGVKIDNVYITTNVKEYTPTLFEQWALDSGLTNGIDGAADNPDGDIYDNHGEYVLGGDPTNGLDIGIQPAFDGASTGYVYSVRNDTALSVSILTRQDLVNGDWTTNAGAGIASNDGGLTEYTYSVGATNAQEFIKLLVE